MYGPMNNILTCLINSMSSQGGGAPHPSTTTPTSMLQAFEVGIINLRASIDRRHAMARGAIPFNMAEFEELSERIWDTRVVLANQIRRWTDRREAAILATLYAELIGTMPDRDGVIR